MRPLALLMLSGLLALTSCADTIDPTPGSFVDPGNNVVAGDPNAADYCAQFGWYGDGRCDTFCAQPDPDCDRGPNPTPDPRPSPDPGPPPEPTPTCEEVGWPRDYSAYGDECLLIDFACADGWVYFEDDCGCGCEEPQNTGPTCEDLFAQGDVDFVSQDPDDCASIRFTCPDGDLGFSDEVCGCGCITPWDVGPVACLDDSRPDVDRIGDQTTCQNIDFACVEGSTYFYDDCGCGCRLVCSDDFECPNGYCEFFDSCNGDSCAPAIPAMCNFPNCDDGTEVVCDALPPTCPADQVASVVNGCYQCLDARSCGPPMGP